MFGVRFVGVVQLVSWPHPLHPRNSFNSHSSFNPRNNIGEKHRVQNKQSRTYPGCVIRIVQPKGVFVGEFFKAIKTRLSIFTD